MRKIKFRGLRKDDGEWSYGCYQNDVIGEGFHTIIYADYKNRYCEDAVDPETVGQYTGLKDKNGREIYEGDVVRGRAYGFNRAPQIVGEVIYDYCEFKVKCVRAGHTMKTELSTVYEVIGNIHEHPHLLEQS